MAGKVCIQSFDESIAYKVCSHVLPRECVILHPKLTYVHSQPLELILRHFKWYLSSNGPLEAVHHVEYLLVLLSKYLQSMFRSLMDLRRDLMLLSLLLFLKVQLGSREASWILLQLTTWLLMHDVTLSPFLLNSYLPAVHFLVRRLFCANFTWAYIFLCSRIIGRGWVLRRLPLEWLTLQGLYLISDRHLWLFVINSWLLNHKVDVKFFIVGGKSGMSGIVMRRGRGVLKLRGTWAVERGFTSALSQRGLHWMEVCQG